MPATARINLFTFLLMLWIAHYHVNSPGQVLTPAARLLVIFPLGCSEKYSGNTRGWFNLTKKQCDDGDGFCCDSVSIKIVVEGEPLNLMCSCIKHTHTHTRACIIAFVAHMQPDKSET